MRLAVALCLVAIGCAPDPPAPPVSPPDAAPVAGPSSAPPGTREAPPAAEAPAAARWTAGLLDLGGPAEQATLTAVRTARHEGFARVVFEFEGGVPAVHLEYIDRPVRACGSGDVVDLPGDGWLQVRFSGARAHTEAGETTVMDRERSLALPVLRGLTLTCDFEGEVTWVAGVAVPNRYRAFTLDAPARLVVDVQQ